MSTIFEERLDREFANLKRTVTKPNILLVGATGVGKSSLVNCVFGADVAEVGVGKPMTRGVHPYRSAAASVNFYDAEGYEVGADQQRHFDETVLDFVDANENDAERQVHIIWYCVASTSARVTGLDRDIVARLVGTGKPAALILTKCDGASEAEVESMSRELSPYGAPVFRATTIKLDGLGYLDLEKLCAWSSQKLPNGLKDAFIRAQRINLEEKRARARAIILQHSAGAGGVGFSPLPFSDAPILLSNQAAMFARILYIYQADSISTLMTGLIKSVGVGAIVSRCGIWLCGEMLKFVPVAGTVIGGMISATVASTITASLGFVVSEFCHRLSTYALEGRSQEMQTLMDSAEAFFSSEFQQQYRNADQLLKSDTDA